MTHNQHATAVSWNGKGILFTGPPGCGKSTLACELIAHGATLVADDQIILTMRQKTWTVHAPETIAGQIHLRDIGIMHVNFQKDTTVDFIFQSTLPATRLSTAPSLGLAVSTLDFKDKNAVKDIKNLITNSASCV